MGNLISSLSSEVYLVSANSAYPHMRVDPEDDFILWGVVTYVIHRPRRI